MLKTLFSKQNWLIKNLPNHKLSCDDLVRECLFNILVHFIDHEKGLEDNYWIEDGDGFDVKEKLLDCYLWITTNRDILVSKLAQTIKDFPDIPENDSLLKFLSEHYVQDVVKIQQELKDKDNNVLDFILKHREYLTTIK